MFLLVRHVVKKRREHRAQAEQQLQQQQPQLQQQEQQQSYKSPLRGDAGVGPPPSAVTEPAITPLGGVVPPAEAHHAVPSPAEPQAPVVPPAEAAAAKAEKKAAAHKRRVYRWKLIAGLVLPFFLASVDLTIVASALPLMASYFDRIDQLNWIVTAYSLPSTSFIPLFGQLSDVFGRHSVLQTAMILMMIGSALCAGAQTWGMLLLGRAIQGVSSAAIMNIIKIVLADKVSLEEQSKNSTIFSFVSGVSYSIGPVIGGYLSAANWRYCFVISVPIAALASALIFFLLRKELVSGSSYEQSTKRYDLIGGLATIDYGGTTIFIFGVGLIILATSWGGASYPWNSAAVLAPLVIGSVLFVAFFFYEWLMEPERALGKFFRKQVPMIPWHLFERKDTFLLAVINFSTGSAMYAVFYFVSIYFNLALGYKASDAGIQLLYYIPGLGVGVYLAMFLANVYPRQTFPALWAGSIIEAVGVAMITWATTTGSTPTLNGMMALSGVGTGLRFMPGTLHAVGVWPERLAAVVSLMDFALPFGGTIALTIMGAVFNNKLAQSPIGAAIQSTGNSGGRGGGNPDASAALNSLPQDVRAQAQGILSDAVKWAFISILPIMGLCVLAATLLGNVWIKTKKGSGAVIYSSYLFALLTGTVKAKKVVNRSVAGPHVRRQEGEEALTSDSPAEREKKTDSPA